MEADTPKRLPRGEVTFLFTDIEGSTRHFHALGDAWIHVIERHNDIVDRAVLDASGAIVKREGDGVFAAFSDAAAAIVAATKAQREICAEAWPIEDGLRVRMGLHTGRAEPIGDDYISLHVHRAARVSAAAHGGQILVSESTAATMSSGGGDVPLRALGRYRLRGFEQPALLFQACDPTLPDSFPVLRAPPAQMGNIRARPTSFVGRSAERRILRESLDQHRLVTLTGPGGVGKTRLASEVAAVCDHADGVWMVELATLDQPGAVAGAVARALEVVTTPGDDLTNALVRRLADREVLLVFDNCEHVIDEVASLTAELIAGARHVRVLATSRVPLDLDGERLVRLAPLGAAEANQLFIERAAGAGAVLDSTHAPIVDRLCHRLDRLPLALELAAARLRSIPIHSLLDRIEHQMGAVSRGDRTRQPRQRSLEALIAWSTDLLDPETAACLYALSTFAGHFTAEAAESVCVGTESVVDHLTSLVESSLVEFAADAARPYYLLETIRHFARLRLVASGREAGARDAHRALHLAAVRDSVDGLLGPDRRRASAWVERISEAADDLVAAFAWSVEEGNGAMASRLAIALALAWDRTDRLQEASGVLAQAISLDRDSPTAARAWALAARVAHRRGDLSEAAALAGVARQLADAHDDDAAAVDALDVLSTVAWLRGDVETCEILALGALEIGERLGDSGREADALNALGLSAEFRGDYQEQLELMERGLQAAHRAGDEESATWIAKNVAVARLRTGRWDSGRSELEDVLEQQLLLGLRIEAAMTAGTLSFVARVQGDADEALAFAIEALNIARDVGSARPLGFALNNLGEIQAELGHLTDARAAYAEALEIGRALGEIERISYCLDGLAALAARAGHTARAVQVLAGAEATRRERGFHLPSDYQAINEGLILGLRNELGADEFARLWADGESWSTEAIVAAALRDSSPVESAS